MGYNIVKVLSGVVFMFQSTFGDINHENPNNNQQGTKNQRITVFNGALRRPRAEIAQHLIAMREQERQQRRIQQQRLDELAPEEQETRQAISYFRQLTLVGNNLWNLEESNSINMDDEQQITLRREFFDAMQQIRPYTTHEVYSALQDYYNNRYSSFVPANPSENKRENVLSNRRQNNYNQRNQINRLIQQEVRRLEQRLTNIQQEIQQLQH